MRRIFTWLRVQLAVAISAVASIGLPAGPAEAYQTYNDHHLTYGVTGQTYWIDGTAGTYSGEIDAGVRLWNATATPVSYARTSTKASSRMDFYGDPDRKTDYCAYTWWYVGSTRADAKAQNWWWSRVYVTPLLLTLRCGDASREKTIVAHEQGHVMGLAHALNRDRIMYSDIAVTTITKPQPDDIAGVNHLY